MKEDIPQKASGRIGPEKAKDAAGIPDDAHEDEPKGTPNSDRYRTEIASSKK